MRPCWKRYRPIQNLWATKTCTKSCTISSWCKEFSRPSSERPFDRVKESQLPESFDQLVQLFRDTHIEELAFVDGLTESELERRFDLPLLGSRPTVAEGLTQVVMHSQNHRGQCLTRIRENGGKPPTLDYIKWAKNQHMDRDHPTPPTPAA
jgi:uncharacterized damage-inducible protein DinB